MAVQENHAKSITATLSRSPAKTRTALRDINGDELDDYLLATAAHLGGLPAVPDIASDHDLDAVDVAISLGRLARAKLMYPSKTGPHFHLTDAGRERAEGACGALSGGRR